MSLTTSVSNKSYTNKDFNSIYVELLEYAKQWAHKWDPTASDESDPGVVLLKLAAIIGDKDNYNIDKNILELMPSSVTQLPAARQLFEQCGYSMHYYQAATGTLRVTLNTELGVEEGDTESYTYTIPQFTMFTDYDSSIVYTSTEPVSFSVGQDALVDVMEGTVANYSINNDSLITVSNLDNKNRLYFTETDIAENGIFITNVNTSNEPENNYEDWKKVDNLEIQEKGKRWYKFGLNIDGSICYIEFPNDIETLMGQGLNIKYIRTSGRTGSVAAEQICQLYVDTKFVRKLNGTDEKEVEVTNDDLTITNIDAIINGLDPQSIDDAFKTYTRVKDTFDTLVSLRDYTNYMVLEHASNGYVCDRTNDIQHTYKVLEASRTANYLTTIVETKEVTYVDKNNSENKATVDQPTMQPFDLCIYALEYVPTVNDEATYKRTFNLTDGKTYANHLNSEDVNSIQHNFIEFDTNRILLIKNKYSLRCTVLPTEKLTSIEAYQLKAKLEEALYKALNSKELTFGARIDPVYIKNVMLECDDRIKDIENTFSTTPFETYVVYKDSEGKMQEMRVDSDSFSGGYSKVENMTKNKFATLKGDLYVEHKTNGIVKVGESDTYDKTNTYYTYSEVNNILWNNFRAEIFAKNVLAGVTPLYDKDSTFSQGLNQSKVASYENITKVSTETTISCTYDETTKTYVSSKLEENESILLRAPNFIDEQSYSSYVKIVYNIVGQDVLDANTKYTLSDEEFIIFFYKAADTDNYYTYVKYDNSSNSKASIISPTFQFPTKKHGLDEKAIEYFKTTFPAGRGETNSLVSVEALDGKTATQYVETLNNKDFYQVLVGQNIIKTQKVNKIQINQNTLSGSNSVYWVLNKTTRSKNKDVYRLFDENTNTYTLKSGEYFIYTNSGKTTIYLLGEGTVLTREGWSSNDLVWEVEVVDTTNLFSEGISILNKYWRKIPLSDREKLFATEMQQHFIGPGYEVKLTVINESLIDKSLKDAADNTKLKDVLEFTSGEINLAGFGIRYTDGSQTYNVDYINDPTNAWKGCSVLNLSTSNNYPQKLSANQSITIYSDDSTEEVTIQGGENSSALILTSSTLNLLGGADVEVPNDEGIEVLAYEANESYSLLAEGSPYGNVRYYEDSYNVEITLTDAVEGRHEWVVPLKPFVAPPGDYLLNVVTGEEIVSACFFGYQESDKYIITSLLPNGAANNIYKLTVLEEFDNSDDNDRIKLGLSVIASENNVDLIIQPLYKYKTKTLKDVVCTIDGYTFEELLLTKLNELDVKKSFDYTATENASILNPLDADMFFDSTHVYNPFTICEWQQANKVDGDITVRLNIV